MHQAFDIAIIEAGDFFRVEIGEDPSKTFAAVQDGAAAYTEAVVEAAFVKQSDFGSVVVNDRAKTRAISDQVDRKSL